MIKFNRIVLYRIIGGAIDDFALLIIYILLTSIFNKNNSQFISVLLLFTSFSIAQICFLKRSTTLGKFSMGLKVNYENSSSGIGLKSMIIRETIGKVISNICFIGYIYILFNDNNQGFHDKLVHSIVIEN